MYCNVLFRFLDLGGWGGVVGGSKTMKTRYAINVWPHTIRWEFPMDHNYIAQEDNLKIPLVMMRFVSRVSKSGAACYK